MTSQHLENLKNKNIKNKLKKQTTKKLKQIQNSYAAENFKTTKPSKL